MRSLPDVLEYGSYNSNVIGGFAVIGWDQCAGTEALSWTKEEICSPACLKENGIMNCNEA